MPEDTDFQKKVQLLHENRQRNSQHLWGATRVVNNDNVTSSMTTSNNGTMQ
jgi:hypothetical protein